MQSSALQNQAFVFWRISVALRHGAPDRKELYQLGQDARPFLENPDPVLLRRASRLGKELQFLWTKLGMP